MIRRNIIFLLSCLSTVFFLSGSCLSGASADNNHIATDSLTIAQGEAIFTQHCSGCHNFRQDGIGPNLSGLTTVASADWIKDFIKDPKARIESGDKRAQQLFNKYHTVMPSFAFFADDEL